MASHHGAQSLQLMAMVGAITAVAASLFLINQHNLKRMWAYSSIENVGIMLIAIGLGSGQLFVIQAVNHAIAKVAIFLQSGNVIQVAGSKRLSNVHGLIVFAPEHALLLAMTTCAVMGVPPFGTFGSEVNILMSAADCKSWLVAIMMIFAVSVSFIAVSMHIGRMVLGTPRTDYRRLPALTTCAMPALLLASSLALGYVFSPAVWYLFK
jgi:hydrogenase-4 component F